MAWCPKCKCEYVEGIKMCADCKVPLVDDLEAELKRQEQVQMAQYQMYMQQMQAQKEMMQQVEETEKEDIRVYHDSKSKAEDFRSSAYTLIIVGALGLLAILLIQLQVIPVRMSGPGKYVSFGVMGGLFLIFIFSGIHSFISAKKYEAGAKDEEDLTKKIKTWAKNNLTKELIIERAQITQVLPEEVKYFRYFEELKNLITEEFGKLDASYLESLSEEIYGTIFED